MEIKEITPDMRTALREKLPDEAVKQHPTKTYLSSIKAIYVIERLNDVFGVGKWSYTQKVIERADNGTVVVQVDLTIPEFGINLCSFGGNDNGGEAANKNFDLGDAYKGAVTDAITKICSMLEIGIDVFKGLHVHTEKPKSTAPENAPWANDNEVNAAVDRISKGDQGVLEALLSTHKLSKANRSKIEAAIANYKPHVSKPDVKPGTPEWDKCKQWLISHRSEAHKLVVNYSFGDADYDQLLKEVDDTIKAKSMESLEAIDAIKVAPDMPSLNQIYNDCQALHTNKEFVDAYAARQKELAKLGKAA